MICGLGVASCRRARLSARVSAHCPMARAIDALVSAGTPFRRLSAPSMAMMRAAGMTGRLRAGNSGTSYLFGALFESRGYQKVPSEGSIRFP